jgi:hypothetical protein
MSLGRRPETMKIVERVYRRLSSLRKDLTNNLFNCNAPLDHAYLRLDSLRYVFRGGHCYEI